MKKFIPMIALMLLAGCGNNSTENQSSPANPPTSEQPPSPGNAVASNSGPATETVTNNPAINPDVLATNGSASTN